MTALTFDGRNFKSISFAQAIQDRYYGGSVDNAAIVGGLTAEKAYGLVPWLYRAVTLRANAVSRMPYALLDEAKNDVMDDPMYVSMMRGFRQLMFLTEAAKVLTGQAYWLIQSNASGFNVQPRWLLPSSLQPQYTTTEGLTHFRRTLNERGNIPAEIGLDQMVWFWEANFSSEVRPGPGPASVALGAASMLYALDAFTANFFNQGAVPITIFPIPLGTPEEDKKEFQSFLRRRMSGVQNAFKMIVMRAVDKLTPVVIGSDLKDTQASELMMAQRDSVAVALGVPPTVLDGKAANFATANSEMMGFILNTIIPETEMLAERANEQFFSRFGLTLQPEPEKLELMQSAQLEQVMAVSTAVGQPVLTVDEGRELLGYEPLPKSETLAPVAAPRPIAGGLPAPVDEGAVITALASWRKAALEAVRLGKAPIEVPVSVVVPTERLMAITTDLKSCVSTAEVRAIFERHWPKKESDMLRLTHALERATQLLEMTA